MKRGRKSGKKAHLKKESTTRKIPAQALQEEEDGNDRKEVFLDETTQTEQQKLSHAKGRRVRVSKRETGIQIRKL